MARKKQKLPFGVGCLASLMLIGSLFLLSFSVLYWLHLGGNNVGGANQAQWAKFEDRFGEGLIVSVFFLGFGLLTLITAIGLLARKFWAYCIYTVMNGVNLGLAGVRLVLHHDLTAIPSLAINVIILIYMFLPRIRSAFN